MFIPNDLYPEDTDVQSAEAYLYLDGDGVYQGDVLFSYRFAGFETVQVQAGTFENCLKLELNVQGTGEDDHAYVWFAEGVGIVKSDARPFGGYDADELVSCSVGG